MKSAAAKPRTVAAGHEPAFRKIIGLIAGARFRPQDFVPETKLAKAKAMQ